jgi:Tfp pilus assembly protein PilO
MDARLTIEILCVAAALLLVWVILLKLKIEALQKEQTKLMQLLKQHLDKMTGDVEVTSVLRGWGKRVQCEEVDTSWVKKKG